MTDPFAGSTALVTGASFGIGRELALQLAPRAARLVLTARTAPALEEVAALCRARGAEVLVLPADLGQAGGAAGLLEALDARGIVVDHLVNNAGLATHGRVAETDADAQLAVIDVNARAPIELATRLLPGMVTRRRGGVLTIASTSAFQGTAWMAAYAGTKACLLAWSEALHVELRGTGVRCTCACPGPVGTGFFRRNHFPGEPPAFVLETPVHAAQAALRAYDRNRSHVVTALLPRLGAWATRLVPRAVVARIAAGYARPGGLGRA